MLNKIKRGLSRKGTSSSKTADKGNAPQSSNHPQANTSPSTRRPASSANPFREDAPPPYSAAVAPTTSSTPQPAIATDDDDPYAFLSTFDTVFLIDDSGSMAGSNWRETAAALKTIAPICTAHDADGIDIYFLNAPDSPTHHGITSARTVEEIFTRVKPARATPTGQRLNNILKPYLRRCTENLDGTKPMNIICITDGQPSDDVESPLIAAAKKLDALDAPAWQVGVQFFQVGKDKAAQRHLQMLDDELTEIAGGEVRDIVDTVPFRGDAGEVALTGEGVLKVVLGSVNRRLDRRGTGGLHR